MLSVSRSVSRSSRLRSRSAACLAALVLVAPPGALVARAANAQAPRIVTLPDPRRGFEDSWYWGVKAGATRVGTAADGPVTAPLAGADWLITRRRGALLVSAEQSFFDRAARVADPSSTDGARVVDVKDSRRYAAAVLAAPIALGRVRPYAGIGLALHAVRSAVPVGRFGTQSQYDYVADRIEGAQSLIAPFATAGVQGQLGRFAVFSQASAGNEQRRSLLNRGGPWQLEAGVRYNVSSAFER